MQKIFYICGREVPKDVAKNNNNNNDFVKLLGAQAHAQWKKEKKRKM